MDLIQGLNIKATVPGSIYTDLIHNKVIGDPYFRNNDVMYKWIGEEDWTFVREFEVECEVFQKNRVILVFHGLDTISSILLNDRHIGNTENMFIRYTFDVKDIIRARNTITISFRSPVKYAKEKHEKQVLNYVIPPVCPLPVQNGECHINYIRKIQSSFSWDWGPSFPTQGIWKHVEVIGFDTAIITDITVITNKLPMEGGTTLWNLDVTVFLDAANASAVSGTFSFYLDDAVLLQKIVTFIPEKTFSGNISFMIDIPQNFPLKLWWPNGLGQQNLYQLKVEASFGNEVTSKTVQIGFRTLELIQEPIKGSNGLSFYFKVNGIPFFSKGSNWIPADSFPERITVQYLKTLLQSAKDANMNMLRVWGGGAYESDEFYNIADELGLFIWQDLMFAVALYPADQNFLNSVAVEVQQQVRRLQHHPSLLLWSGNNENEQGLAQYWWPSVSTYFEQYKSDYIKLYVNTIMPIVTKHDPNRPFLVSSPSNGVMTKQEGWIATNPQDFAYGDVHFYTYTADEWDWKTYPRARFISEYGFQSYPSFESFANVSEPYDWIYPRSNFLSHRQHHMFGDLEIGTMISKHFMLPSVKCGVQAFKDLLYLSQITQAVSIKIETETYRRSQSEIINGLGRTMGALYWQLNDIWQAPSWSSIEYGGKWKMLHYYVQDFFSPVLVSPFEDNDNVKAYVISDLTETLYNVTLVVSVYKWKSFSPVFTSSLSFKQPPVMAQNVYTRNISGEDGILKAAQCDSRHECFLYFQLFSEDGNPISPDNFLLLSEFKNAVGLGKSNVTVRSINGPIKSQASNYTFEIVIATNSISPFVWLEIPGIQGHFSANGFIMVSKNKHVLFYSSSNVKLLEVVGKLTVRSLSDVCS